MSEPVADGYAAYYADKLWQLLPAVYRAADGDGDEAVRGPLRELIERFGVEAAVLRRSIDRLWEDQSIESCDDWVTAYIADLLATNLVASLDARGKRLDVAKTIYYRRRKGTVALIEELASDITGWNARVVEFFRRLGRTRHGLDPPLGWSLEREQAGVATLPVVEGLVGARTRTLSGGSADLRDVYGATRPGTAFDEFFHTADVRLGRGATGWYGIPRVGIFLWRLISMPVVGSTPVRVAGCPHQITFDPSGRDSPLFAVGNRSYGQAWVSPREPELPGPIEQPILQSALAALYGWEKAFGLFADEAVPTSLLPLADVTADAQSASSSHYVEAARGRAFLLPGTDPAKLLVAYHHGFPSTIGAGGYDRRIAGEVTQLQSPAVDIVGGGNVATLPASGTVQFRDSLTYNAFPATVQLDPGQLLVLSAANKQRPVVRLTPGSRVTFIGQVDATEKGSELVLDGLWLCGFDVVLKGVFERVTIKTTTLDPGNSSDGVELALAADGALLAPGHLLLEGSIRHLEIERSILGPVLMDPDPAIAEAETIEIRDSIVQAVLQSEKAVDLRLGSATLLRTTLLGAAQFHRVDASNVIFNDVALAVDAQHGCTRYSAIAPGSALPRRYECVDLEPGGELFSSRAFGAPAFAQLLEAVPESIAEGADDGSEMGAYCRERTAIKRRSLLIKLQDYMPIGVTPVVIYET